MMSVTTGMTDKTGEKRSFKDKMKFFEQEIEEQKTVKPKGGARKFSYLNEHEVQNIKKEEERKMSLMSQDELMKQFNNSHGEDPAFDMVMKSLAGQDSSDANQTATVPSKTKPASSPTKPDASLDNRGQPPTNGNNTSLTTSLTGSLESGNSTRRKPVESQMSTLERRAREEERRAAIRAARMRTLEADANRAQAVIARSKQQQQQQQQQQTDAHYRPNGSSDNNEDPSNYANQTNNTQYSSLSVNTRISEPKVKESSRVIGERVNRRVEEVWDPELGRHVFRTVEYVEKIVETEVKVKEWFDIGLWVYMSKCTIE